MISSRTKLCCVIGDPVTHSLSPLLHNAAYRLLEIDSDYNFMAFRVRKDELSDAMRGFRALGVTAISCTMPHKIEIVGEVDELDETARTLSAVNSVVNREGVFTGYNTDCHALIELLKPHGPFDKKRGVVIGAGGMGRAAALALKRLGLSVTVLNRTVENARSFAERLEIEYAKLNEVHHIKEADVVVHATSCGLVGALDPKIFRADLFNRNQIVVDAVYSGSPTSFFGTARQSGARAISGVELFVRQAVLQCKLYTGLTPDHELLLDLMLDVNQESSVKASLNKVDSSISKSNTYLI